MKSKTEVLHHIKEMLTDIKVATDGKGWTKLASTELCNVHGVKQKYFRNAVATGVILRNPERTRLYKWNGITDVTDAVAKKVKNYKGQAPNLRKGMYPASVPKECAATSSPPEPKYTRITDEWLISELKSRGYTGSLTPPKPSPILL